MCNIFARNRMGEGEGGVIKGCFDFFLVIYELLRAQDSWKENIKPESLLNRQ